MRAMLQQRSNKTVNALAKLVSDTTKGDGREAYWRSERPWSPTLDREQEATRREKVGDKDSSHVMVPTLSVVARDAAKKVISKPVQKPPSQL